MQSQNANEDILLLELGTKMDIKNALIEWAQMLRGYDLDDQTRLCL